jgi:hypothetical protein
MRVECPHCGQPVPVNAPSESAHCAGCTRDFPLPPAIFSELLLRFDDAYPSRVEPFAKGTDATVGELRVHATYHSGAIVCEKCGGELSLTTLPREGTVTFACAACGDPAACFPVPEWLRALVPTATHIAVSDATASPSAVASQPRHEDSKPILMPCPGCGASLKLTSDATRTLKCAFCNNDVYLPDDLWRRLHPMRTMAPWFVRFEGVSRGELARAAVAREEEAEQARQWSAARRASAMEELAVEADDELQSARKSEATSTRNWILVIVTVMILFFAGVFGYGLATGKFH